MSDYTSGKILLAGVSQAGNYIQDEIQEGPVVGFLPQKEEKNPCTPSYANNM